MKTALYTGSFDPLTNGHLDVLAGALAIADKVVMAIGMHPGKKPVFSFDEREAMIADVLKTSFWKDAGRVSVMPFDGLAVDAAKTAGAQLIVRGLRNATDFDYEMQMSGMNGEMSPLVRTIFIPANPNSRHITATLVRQIAAMGGNVAAFVPNAVNLALQSKFNS